MAKWYPSDHPGIRYREHPTRKHGLRPDRYYTIRFSVDGKLVEECIGWDTELKAAYKNITKKEDKRVLSKNAEEEAIKRISELRENQRRGEGPRTLAEKRAAEATKFKEKADEAEKAVKDRLTFKELAEGAYIKASKATKKNAASWKREEQLFKLWINPVIGDKPLKDVAPIHLEKIKADMAKAKRAPRSIHYCLGVVRQVFNFAIRNDLFEGTNPVSKVKLPAGDNRRLRFLTRDEANAILKELATKSPDVRDMALISLHTGIRAGEVFGLTWADVDIDRGVLILRDTKNGRTRAAFMTEAVKEVFRAKERGLSSEIVFPDRRGKRMERISNTFARAVDTLKLNEGIEDRRHQVTFHTLRHTYASWHVENGTDLYAVKELLGHSDFKMTARYSHLGENTLQAAVKRLDSTLQAPVKVVALVKKEG